MINLLVFKLWVLRFHSGPSKVVLPMKAAQVSVSKDDIILQFGMISNFATGSLSSLFIIAIKFDIKIV